MNQLMMSFIRSERGASLAEYCLLIVLIAVACITAVTLLGSNIVTRLYDPAAAI